VSDYRHDRVYTTDRLGMPLIETVTYPDMLNPDEAAEAGQYLRYLVRSTGHVRTGIGAARQDVNVSITGGTRVEIKGVSHIKWIPELTHNEMFRQAALLEIAKILRRRVDNPDQWAVRETELSFDDFLRDYPFWLSPIENQERLVAINLPEFKGIPSFFTQPGHDFGDELGGRVKVIACLERPNIITSEMRVPMLSDDDWTTVIDKVNPGENDAQVLVWGPDADVKTAVETIEERCRMAFDGVPNETRKSLPDGTTIFERVLPGPDRMYPDTDSAPIPIPGDLIERLGSNLPTPISERMQQLRDWRVPGDAHAFILANNLMPVMEQILGDFAVDPKWLGSLIGHDLKHLEGSVGSAAQFPPERLYQLIGFVSERQLNPAIVREMLPVVYASPTIGNEQALARLDYEKLDLEQIAAQLPELVKTFRRHRRSKHPEAMINWLMGQLRSRAIGNVTLKDLRTRIKREVGS
jgi:glutamyl-tRNA(Gln) amidotransferase subunit E